MVHIVDLNIFFYVFIENSYRALIVQAKRFSRRGICLWTWTLICWTWICNDVYVLFEWVIFVFDIVDFVSFVIILIVIVLRDNLVVDADLIDERRQLVHRVIVLSEVRLWWALCISVSLETPFELVCHFFAISNLFEELLFLEMTLSIIWC